MNRFAAPAVALILLCARAVSATSFVVPSDDEMVARSSAIVIGTVEDSYAQYSGATIETQYSIRVERAIKGPLTAAESIRVISPGGVIGDRGVLVPAAPHFRNGERVLLFLHREGERWEVTDLALGRFRFARSGASERLLVRDVGDVVGWDRAGRPHREPVRREAEFLRYLEERSHGRAARPDYFVEDASASVEVQQETASVSANATSYPAATYTSWVNNQPVRWANVSAGIGFFKRSDQNIPGAADGGVATIQSGLAAWTNECGSVINLLYNGQLAKASANFDGTNVVEFNDPQQRISGSWGGSGTVAITFISFGNPHSFLGQSWLSITDADVVFQDGYPATNASFASAMTHELGHAVGWRHSNQNHATGGACDPSVEECTSAAIMNSSVSANYGFVLQPFDVNAAQSVYPGGSCGPAPCTAPSIGAQPSNATVPYGGGTTLYVTAAGSSLSFQWYAASNGSSFAPVAGATGSSLSVAPGISTAYYVVVSNPCGTVTSNRAVVTVTGGTTAGPSSARVLSTSRAEWRMAGAADFSGDGYPDILLQNTVTRDIYVWMMQGAAALSTNTFIGRTYSTDWQVRAMADFNLDGSPDIVVQNLVGGEVYIWTMNRTTVVNSGNFVFRAAPNWRVVAAADFSGEGSPDLLLQNQTSRETAVWTMSGLTLVNPNFVLMASAPGWMAYAAGDLNRDGYADIFLRNSVNGANAVWTTAWSSASGPRVVSTSTLLPTLGELGWRMVTVADFNRDGSVDILWHHSSTREAALWYLNGAAIRTP